MYVLHGIPQDVKALIDEGRVACLLIGDRLDTSLLAGSYHLSAEC